MIVAIVQARMSSSRLPGKVMKDLMGKPMMIQQLNRLSRMKGVNKLVVATSVDASDDPVEEVCHQHGFGCYRGSLDDVLDRYYQTAKSFGADHVVRLTADCPLTDPELIDQLIEFYFQGGYEYASNNFVPTLPDGLDGEVFSFEVLEEAWKEATLPSEREHVTPFIRNNPSRYRIGSFTSDHNLSYLRWTVDEPEDFELVQKIYATLFPKDPDFSTAQILELTEEIPQLQIMNLQYARGEGLERSKKKDEFHTRYAKSEQLYERALSVIPLGSQTFSKSRTQFPLGVTPLFVEKAKGSKVWDADGHEYIDFTNSLGAINLGYNDPDVMAAVKEQMEQGTIFSLSHPIEITVAEKLTEIIPCAEMVRFGKNGSDATTGAIRLARAYTGRDHILTCGYHGWHDWYIGTTPRNMGVPESTSQLSHPFSYNDIDSLRQRFEEHPNQVAAVIMEPMARDYPQDGFLQAVKEVAHANGALLIFDEMIMGFRHAVAGGQELFQVTPDLATFGKGIANGYPLSVICGKAEIMKLLEEIFFSFTFGGETLSLAASLATIEKIQSEPVLDHILQKGQRIIDGVNGLIEKHSLQEVLSIPGHPAWTFLQFKDCGPTSSSDLISLFMQEASLRNIMTRGVHTPSYAHTDADIDQLLEVYDEVFPIIAQAVHNGPLRNYLYAKPIEPLFKVR